MKTDNGLQALVESRMQEMRQRQSQLVEGWGRHIKAINEHMKSKCGRTMNETESFNVAQCLENALQNSGLRSQAKLFEATTENAIEFLGVQLPVIAALLPSLCLNDIASVQALDRRIGAVFYMDVQYGSTKGDNTEGDTMLSALTGHSRARASQRQYASTLVKGERLAGSADGSISTTLTYAPGVDVTTSRRSAPEKTIQLKDSAGTVIGSDSNSFSGHTTEHAGTIRSAADASLGTVTAAGVVAITCDADSGGYYTLDYCYQYDKPVDAYGNRTGVPEANIAMAQSTVTALDFPIRSKYSLGAAIDVQKAHGINLESEFTKYLGGEVCITGFASLAIAA